MTMAIALIHGCLGRDAEMRYTAKGAPVVNFSVATDDGFGDDKTTIWWDCSFFGERAEKVLDYLVKGKEVAIAGRLTQDTYEKDGEKKTKTKVTVIELSLGKNRPNGDGQAAPPARAAGQPASKPAAARKPKISDGQFEEEIDIPVA